ncbi:MAG: endonuclease III [Lachnospiraceae bacterium]|nr:endonuclease III [Lachnospiraceae bacterium]
MTKRLKETLDLLDTHYGPDVECSLDYQSPFELLIATILSAQCTDARVNIVTKDLFRKYTSVESFANAKQEELEKDIHSIGFYKNKAKNIIACCRKLLLEFGGDVPRTIEELTSLPGVGRKTANVIRSHVYGDAAIVVDTHVGRISRRLGMTAEEDPEKVEKDLMKKLPKDHWSRLNTQLITHGREICMARGPKCGECFLPKVCKYYKENK